MAVPGNTYVTYPTIGIREDLIDIITNIDPIDTYVTGLTGNKRSMQTYHEWQTDTLAAAAANAQVEGDDATSTAAVPTTRTGNYTQILRKTFQVSDTNRAVVAAGRGDELMYQKTMKNLKELARDIEYALVINSSSAVGASGTARTLNGLDGWIADNCTNGGTGVGSSVLIESTLNDCLQDIWADGGRPQHLLCGAFQKRAIDGFSTNTREIMAEKKTLVAPVDIYKSSFGNLAVKLHHQINTTIPSRLMILGDMNLWNKAWLRPVKAEELARTGASTQMMIEAELTLESLQEKGSGKIANLTTS